MVDYTKYEDLNLEEVFPQGKMYRISFCATNRKMMILCSAQRDFDILVETFSDVNKASFFMKQYGYSVPQRIQMINQFGYFAPGLLFSILKTIKLRYGTVGVVAMSQECKNYVTEFLTPLKKILDGRRFDISNVSEDSGRNEELTKQGKNPFLFRDYQKKAIENLLFKGYGRGMINLPTACHEKGHPILMYNGEIKKIEDIVVGDLVMGPDSKPRKVLKLHNGFDEMYRINTSDHTSFVVNQNHVLSLVRTKEKKKYPRLANTIDNVTVKDYLSKAKWWKHIRKLYHVGVNFEDKNYQYKIPPYIFGLLLGDGSFRNAISFTSIDKELLDEIEKYFISINCIVRKTSKHNNTNVMTYFCVGASRKSGNIRHKNTLMNTIREMGLFNHCSEDKFIPFEYKVGSRKDRLEMLAGLIDTDGCIDKNRGVDYMSKSKQLAEDFDFIARSLGFKSYIRKKWCFCQTGAGDWYYRVTIHGDIWTIPLKCRHKVEAIKTFPRRTNVLRASFKIEHVGIGEYFGFELDGDHLYLDGKFLVHHNSGKSFSIANYCYNLHKNVDKDYNILLLVPNKQLVFQMYNDFKDYGYDMSLVTMFTAGLKKNEAYNPKAKIIIANRQYVFTNKKLLPEIDVLFCDEVHQCCAETTSEFIENLDCGLKVGCSGSIPKDKIGRWKLIGMFGDVVHAEEITDLQKRGFISNLKLIRINVTDMNVQNNRNYLFHLNPLRRYCLDENGYSEIPFNAAHEAEHEYYEVHYKDLYKPVLEKIGEYDGNTLFLFDRIEFGKRLFEMSGEIFKGRKIHYIDGSVDIHKRLEITQRMEDSGDNVLFAERATFSTGVNVKRLTNLVFISSSKSFPMILQSIGRTLRLHDSKKEARIIDINFNCKYSKKHLMERLEIYRSSYNKVPDENIDITIKA